MAWSSSRGKWDWKQFLTDEESRLIEDIDRQREALSHRLAELSAIRGPIQNRAIQRAKYAHRKDAA